MKIHTTTGSVVGDLTETHWAQTFKTPYAYGLVEAEDTEGVARTVGMHIVTKLVHELSSSLFSIRSIQALIDEVWSEEVHTIALVVPAGKIAVVVMRGIGRVYLKRNGQIAPLLTAQGSTSGGMNIGDIFILTSKTCTEVLLQEEIIGIFNHLATEEVAERMTMQLHEKKQATGGAAFLIEVTDFIEEDAQEISSDDTSEQGEEEERKTVWATMPTVNRDILTVIQRKTMSIKRALSSIARLFRKTDMRITTIIITLFFISVVIGIRREVFNRKSASYGKVMTEATRIFEEGTALMDLNPVKGRERLTAAKAVIEPIRSKLTNRTREERQLIELYSNISYSLVQAMKVYNVTPALFFDAALIKAESSITSCTLFEDMLGLLDASHKTVFSLGVAAKNGQIIAGGDAFTGATLLTVYGNTAYIVVSSGIHAVTLQGKQTRENVIKKNDDWGEISAVAAYSGNLYLSDSQKGRIWKYMSFEKGFSDIREYLNPDTLPDLSKITNMAIDGSVWFGTTEGKILKFSQGKEASFTPTGVDPSFGTTLYIYTGDAVKHIYVLDTANKRVVLLDKEGMYVAQYVWKEDISPMGLVVSEKQGKILLLADGKLFSIDIQ